jgi:alpha-methylacyl-CoA racemase
MTAQAGPLAGTRIIELAGIGPLPYAGMLLADMGADILLVESHNDRGTKMPLPIERDPLFRGRTRLTLDLKLAADRERLLQLLPATDVLMEGFRPGVLERLGLAPETCFALNPRLVIGRVTGWGQQGPLALTAGHDPNYIALTGALHAMGYPDRPPLPPLNVLGDFAGGSLFLVSGVLAALLSARATGKGQVVDASILDGTASLMSMIYAMRHERQWSAQRGSNLMDGSCPFGTVYETGDGLYMAVCALEPPFYAEFIRRLGISTATLPAQWQRDRWPELRLRFAAEFKLRSRKEWEQRFAASDACVTPVLSTDEAPGHAHNVARGVFVGDNAIPAAAPRFSGTPSQHAATPNSDVAALLTRWSTC